MFSLEMLMAFCRFSMLHCITLRLSVSPASFIVVQGDIDQLQ